MLAPATAEADRVPIQQSPALGAGRRDPTATGQMIAGAFRDHSASIQGLALRTTRDPELAADVTQEAFLRLVSEAQAGRCPDNVGAWLYRTSANLIVSRARRAAVARRLAPRLVRTDGPAQPDAGGPRRYRDAPVERPVDPGTAQNAGRPPETHEQAAAAPAGREVGVLGRSGNHAGLRDFVETLLVDVPAAQHRRHPSTQSVHRGFLPIEPEIGSSAASRRASLRRARQTLE